MKMLALVAVVSFLVLSGLALASQSGEQKQDRSTMEHMMKDGEGAEKSEHMMRMMKMMDQCSAMMESMHARSGSAEDGQKK